MARSGTKPEKLIAEIEAMFAITRSSHGRVVLVRLLEKAITDMAALSRDQRPVRRRKAKPATGKRRVRREHDEDENRDLGDIEIGTDEKLK
jgi:hypothetical protein